ncbi:MAG: metal-dependent transcriptional regulator [Caldilineae bacterium]|nr:MAG: metal-dependent transcriptional regulator [Caldilineae bacterium]
MEDYLKTIYKLGRRGERVTTSAIAERLEVSPASVTNMVKRLADMNLVTHEPYRGVALTEAGKKIALETIRHHRLLELYLAEALGIPWDKVHAEAEKLEHVLSDDLEMAIADALGDPLTDPHGAPIPTIEGELPEPHQTPLAEVEAGQTVIIRQVSDEDAAKLRYLATLGLFPNTAIEVLDVAPFDGPLTLRVGDAEHVVGRELARNVFVTHEPQEE